MSYPINYPTPQGANVQIFRGSDYDQLGSGLETPTSRWVKPQGASFVWFTLIGGGGGSKVSGTGGGSGAVTNFMCPAFLIPDSLLIFAGVGGKGGNATDSKVVYQQKDGSGYLLLRAIKGAGTSGGAATAANAFTAMGFYQSIAGQDGVSGAQSASTTTFLSGGGGGTITANYGYSSASQGVFQMNPIIVGVGGNSNGKGGAGCGGGTNGEGGDGLVVIITW